MYEKVYFSGINDVSIPRKMVWNAHNDNLNKTPPIEYTYMYDSYHSFLHNYLSIRSISSLNISVFDFNFAIYSWQT